MRSRFAWLADVVLACGIVAVMGGCLFDTRDPAPPDDPGGGGGCAATPLDVPDAVFVAMRCAIREQTDAAYERVISNSFVFSPTLQDSLDSAFEGTTVYDGWNKDVEMSVLGLMLADAQYLDVAFSPSREINNSTFVRFRVPYVLTVVDIAAPTDTVRYAGVAKFDVRNEGGEWRLTFWDEIESVPNASTWGYLKGILRLRLNP